MAMTKSIRADLKGIIISHEGQEGATVTPTGMLKTPHGLIIPPSTIGNGDDTHTGALAELTVAERRAYHVEEASQTQCQPQALTPAKPAKRRGRSQTTDTASVPEPVLVKLVVPGIGVIPSQYVHCYRGAGVVILGMNQYSYMPAVATTTANGIQGVLELASYPGVRFVFAGYEFTDKNNIRNLILMQVPDMEENEDDGQEIE